MGEGKFAPELFGLRIAVNDFFQVCGDLDFALAFVEFHGHVDGVSGFAFGSGTELRVHDHHVAVAHVHERTAEGESVDRAFDRDAAFALENFDHIEGRLERSNLRAILADEFDFEFVFRHVGLSWSSIFSIDILVSPQSSETGLRDASTAVELRIRESQSSLSMTTLKGIKPRL